MKHSLKDQRKEGGGGTKGVEQFGSLVSVLQSNNWYLVLQSH